MKVLSVVRNLGLVLIVALAASLLSATSIRPMPLEKMAADSTDVVEARAIDGHSAWNADRTMIYTYTRFEVRKTLKGTAPNVITVKQMGGHAGGISQRVSGVRQWQPGDEAVLFLRASVENDGTLVVTGLVQGNFKMTRLPSGEVMVSNGVPEVNVLDQVQGGTSAFHGSTMTVRQMEDRVRKAVEQ
jgi:hypothetical protein